MNKDNSFGEKLKQLRRAKGLSQEKLAELAGVHEKHISKLELGIYKPSYETLTKIKRALGLDGQETELDLSNVSGNDDPFYVKSMQILDHADKRELEFYYLIIRAIQKGLELFLPRRHSNEG